MSKFIIAMYPHGKTVHNGEASFVEFHGQYDQIEEFVRAWWPKFRRETDFAWTVASTDLVRCYTPKAKTGFSNYEEVPRG